MKSSYELVMERMGEEMTNHLPMNRKRKLLKLIPNTKPRSPSGKYFRKSLSDAQAQGNEEEIELVRRQLNDEVADLEAKSEAEKDKIRES